MGKKRAQEAIKILQPLADMDLSKFEGAEDVTVEEEVNNTKVTVNATKVKETETTIEATKVKETTIEVNEVEVVEEVAVAQPAPEVQGERQPSRTFANSYTTQRRRKEP